MLDPRRLRVLTEFAREGTIARAADSLAFTPSAVSQQLAQLQREAGVPLFERVGRRLELTDAGHTLVAHAGAIIDRLELAESDLAAKAGRVSGVVNVAAFQTAALALVPRALTRVAREHPDLRLEFVEQEAEASLPLLIRGAVGVAIAEEYEHAPRPRDPRIDRAYLPPDEMLLVLPQEHAAVKSGEPIALTDLAHETWATSAADTAFAQGFERICRAVGGFEPEVRHRTTDMRILLELVAGGHALALLPALGRPEDHPQVAVRRMAGASYARSVFIATRRVDRGRPSIEATIEALRRP